MYRKLVGPSGMTTTATIATTTIPFVFRAKSRKALLPFRSRISSAYCGGDPFFHHPSSPVKSLAVIT